MTRDHHLLSILDRAYQFGQMVPGLGDRHVHRSIIAIIHGYNAGVQSARNVVTGPRKISTVLQQQLGRNFYFLRMSMLLFSDQQFFSGQKKSVARHHLNALFGSTGLSADFDRAVEPAERTFKAL
jgi:hypothetical protein